MGLLLVARMWVLSLASDEIEAYHRAHLMTGGSVLGA